MARPEDDQLGTAIDGLVDACSNWGRWGPDDELGTLNHVTPRHRQRAIALAREGEVLSLGRRVVTKPSPANHRPMLHHMVHLHGDLGDRPRGTASDFVGVVFHGFDVTHIDALCHQSWRGRLYNDRPADSVSARTAASFGSVEVMRDGILGRGVLLDVPAQRGVEWLEPGEAISPEELDACASSAGVEVGAGDLLLVRTGRDRREERMGPHDPVAEGNPGLGMRCAPWLREHDVAVLLTDVQADVMEPARAPHHPMPLHVTCLVAMGMPLVDNVALEALAAACAARGRWEFLLTVSPLWLQRTTGSPVNPTAVF